MAKRTKRSSYFPIKLPVNTLSGGVGRQAPSKRLPTEAEELNNMFCSTERSIDKRSGFSFLSDNSFSALGIEDIASKDLWYYWFEISEDVNYLIILDYKATDPLSQLMWVFQVSRTDFSVQAVQTGINIDPDVRKYLTYHDGSDKKAADVLRAVSIGSTVLVLNTLVKAGYTSDGVERTQDDVTGYFLHNLDGSLSTEIDHKGGKVTYETTVHVDPQGTAEYWSASTQYLWGDEAVDQGDGNPARTAPYKIFKVKDSLVNTNLPSPTNTGSSHTTPPEENDDRWDDTGRRSAYIPVEEYIYPDPDKQHLGQSVAQFSELRFPPTGDNTVATAGDRYLHNGAHTMLTSLYPYDGPQEEGHLGKGKIYYLSQAYLANTPGWYRVIDEVNKPFLKKVRTPDVFSVIDRRRMPMQIYISGIASDDLPNGGWRIREVAWDPRTSGDKDNNPGPSPFKDENNTAQQKAIKAMAFYRDRLFLSTDDTLFSSRLGDWDNFFIDDPATIEFRDPIDLRVSSNKYTPITWLVPYRDFLFLATSGETQYELMGSENQISPLSAEIAPTSFYPMSSAIRPMLLNNNLFFYAHNRLYIYFGSTTDSPQQAFEVSRPAPNYLPRDFWDVTSSSAHNTLFVVAGTEPSNEIFCFRNVISQERILQNAFFKFTSGTGPIQSINAMGDYLFTVTPETIDGTAQLCLQKMYLYPDTDTTPRLDSRIITSFESEYDSIEDKTTFTFPTYIQEWDQGIMLQGSRVGEIVNFETTPGDFKAKGDWTDSNQMWVGNKYTASAELSPLFVRDDENNVIPGTFNLRYGLFRHYKTGLYDVEVTRKNRDPVVYRFSPVILGDEDAVYGSSAIEENGTFKFSILGYSEDIGIKVVSEFPHPMNITNMEFTGKFKRLPHFLTT